MQSSLSWSVLSLLLSLLSLLRTVERGLRLLWAPSIPPGKAAMDIAYFGEFEVKGNFTINMDFKQGQPLLAQLIQS